MVAFLVNVRGVCFDMILYFLGLRLSRSGEASCNYLFRVAVATTCFQQCSEGVSAACFSLVASVVL